MTLIHRSNSRGYFSSISRAAGFCCDSSCGSGSDVGPGSLSSSGSLHTDTNTHPPTHPIPTHPHPHTHPPSHPPTPPPHTHTSTGAEVCLEFPHFPVLVAAPIDAVSGRWGQECGVGKRICRNDWARSQAESMGKTQQNSLAANFFSDAAPIDQSGFRCKLSTTFRDPPPTAETIVTTRYQTFSWRLRPVVKPDSH